MTLIRALAAACLGVAACVAVALAQGGAPSAEAQGYAALLPGGTQGAVAASTGGRGEGASTLTGLRPAGGGTIGTVRVRVEASSSGTRAVAEGTVEASGLSLLDGRVAIASLRMAARGGAGAGLTDAAAAGVTVDGAAVAVAPGSRVEVAGVGTLVFFEQVSDGAGGVRANGLRVEVTDPGAASVIGQPFVIGHLDLAAVDGTAPATTAPAPATASPRAPATTAPRASTAPAASPAEAAPPRAALAPASPLGLPRRPAPSLPVADSDGYVFPVVGESGFTDDYAAPRAGTGWHHGNDIFAATGTPVVAVAAGTLSRVGVNTLGGNRLWLTDDAGNAFYYAHLSAYAPAAVGGARVEAGQVIGFVGNTGQAITTPPHLHFEIHPREGDSVNPYPYLLAWQRGDGIPRAFLQAATSTSPTPAAGAVLVDGAPERDPAPAPDDGLAVPAT